MISGYSMSIIELPNTAYDLLFKTLMKAIQTPISISETNSRLSVDIILENDVFTLDDILRLFIQQYLIALYNDRYDLIPDDWESKYPAYARTVKEINNILDLFDQRKLSEISIKDIRPLIKSITPKVFEDIQRLRKKLDQLAKESDSLKDDL